MRMVALERIPSVTLTEKRLTNHLLTMGIIPTKVSVKFLIPMATPEAHLGNMDL